MTLTARKSLMYIHDDVEFYPHQIEGVRHLARMTSFLLADEPGLGKSLQALTVFAIDVERGIANRLLVVCPPTLKGNWLEEIHDHTGFQAMILEGAPAKREEALNSFAVGDWHILIVNYEQLKMHADRLNAMGFDMIVYDEAHYMKNRRSGRTKDCHRLVAPRHGLLTGTPLMNNVGDLWSLLHRIDPKAFPNYFAFLNRYAIFGGYQSKQIIGVKNEAELKERLAKYMLRRRKDEVLDLPEKQYIQIKVDLHPEQAKLLKMIKEQEKVVLPFDPTPREIDNALTKFLYQKQVCGTTATMHGYPDHSFKLDRAVELTEEIADNGHHLVVYTQFRDVLYAMELRLRALGAPTYVLHGDVKQDTRIPITREWAAHERPAVLLSMMQVGGVGLNLTKARHMIRLDKDFTPAVNEQVEDRLHRIGADLTQPVQIFDFICRGTVESRVEQILRHKDTIIGAVVNDSDFKRKLIAALIAAEEEEG